MDRKLDGPLWAATATTFEHLGFLFAEPVGPGEETRDAGAWDELAGASVRFGGALEGSLQLWVSRSVAREVAGTMLASSPVSEGMVRDTLGELSNVICGNFLPSLAGEAAEFTLSPPEPLEGADGGEADAEVHMTLDDGRGLVRLFLVHQGPPESS